MLKSATLLVVGAGASVELGFPTGPQLKDEIIKSSVSRLKEQNLKEAAPKFAAH